MNLDSLLWIADAYDPPKEAIVLVVSRVSYRAITETLATCWGCRCEEGGHTWAMTLIEREAWPMRVR